MASVNPAQLNQITYHKLPNNHKINRFLDNNNLPPINVTRIPIKTRNCLSNSNSIDKLVNEFVPEIPIEEAVTPPSSWYTDPSFYSLELHHVFYQGWQLVGCIDQIKDAHSYFTGRLGKVEYVICRDSDGEIRAFHNVCRHHASPVACGSGKKTCFVCPYHGWTYGLGGNLLRAPRITGLRKFDPKEYGLLPIKVAAWGPFIIVNFGASQEEVVGQHVDDEWLGSSSKLLSDNGVDSSLSYICRREYTLECNWKVFCDNYLDGGYHVPHAHKNLASGLDLDSYTTQIFERVSIQRCESLTGSGDDFDRLGSKALYAFVYPNFMINRYGPWMDTNLVLPLGPRKCRVVFDYFLDSSLKIALASIFVGSTKNSSAMFSLTTRTRVSKCIYGYLDDTAFIERSLKDSEEVQMEDIVLCEGVQRGLESPAYNCGRYAPAVEKAMYHFHCLLHSSLTGHTLGISV